MNTRAAPPRLAHPLPVLLLAAIGLLALVLYLPGLSSWMLLDDYPVLEPLLDGGSEATLRSQVLSESGPLKRPVAMLSFIASRWLSPELWTWKLTNVAVHLGIGAGIYFLLVSLQGLLLGRRDASASWLAFAVASIWLVHPLQVSTVLYTVQRMTQLAALFSVLGLLAWVSGRRRHAATGGGRLLLLSTFVVFLPLAALSKETGLLLVGYVALTELLYRCNAGRDRALRVDLPLVLVVAGCLLPMAAAAVHYLVLDLDALLHAHALRGVTLGERLLTEARVLWLYIAQVVTPAREAMGFFHDDIVKSTGLFAPPVTTLALTGLVALLCAAVSAARAAPLVSWGIAVFFVGHALESTIFPLELVFEHRNYLPSLGILVAVAGVLDAALTGYRRLELGAAFAVVALFSLVTLSRTAAWSSEDSAYLSFYEARPESQRATTLVAEALTRAGDLDTAYQLVSRLPHAGARVHELYLLCRGRGRIEPAELARAEAALVDAGLLDDYAVSGMIEVANLGLDDNCAFDRGAYLDFLAAATRLTTHRRNFIYKLMFYQAHYQHSLGQTDAAIATLAQTFDFNPSEPVPLLLAAEWEIARGRADAAASLIARARRINANAGRDYGAMIAATEALLEESMTRNVLAREE